MFHFGGSDVCSGTIERRLFCESKAKLSTFITLLIKACASTRQKEYILGSQWHLWVGERPQ